MTLATVDPSFCPNCGQLLGGHQWDQLPLLRHAGHGAAQRTVVRSCPCGWRLTVEHSEVKP